MASIEVRGLLIGEGRPKICAPLVGRDSEELAREVALTAAAAPDLVEFRIDFFREVGDPEKVTAALRLLRRELGETPILFTFRTKGEGGQADIGWDRYAELNELACGSGLIDLVDLELFAPEPQRSRVASRARALGVRLVVSNHDFGKTPDVSVMVGRLAAAAQIGDIPKIAVMPCRAEDVLALLAASVEAGKRLGGAPRIALSMGGIGAVSRLTGEVFGSAVTFGSVVAASAPGQIPVQELRVGLDIVHGSMR